MNVGDLLDDLRQRGASIEARGDTLHVEAPAGALTPELRAALAEEKPALLAALRSHPWYPTFACPSCGWPLPILRQPRFCLACRWSEP